MKFDECIKTLLAGSEGLICGYRAAGFWISKVLVFHKKCEKKYLIQFASRNCNQYINVLINKKKMNKCDVGSTFGF